MKKTFYKRLSAAVLAIAISCTACGGSGAQTEQTQATETTATSVTEVSATTMRLAKHEGALSVEDGKGAMLEPRENMKVYSGYQMQTEETSFAWIDLDSVKLAKMDETTEVEIQKENKDLELRLKSGGLFFYVAEPLEDDETMKVSTSTIIVGIRGTSGWVEAKSEEQSSVYILEGTVEIHTEEEAEPILLSGGNKAVVTHGEDANVQISVSAFPAVDIPEYIVEEVEQNEELAGEIFEMSGLDVPNAYAAGEAYQTIRDEYLAALNVGDEGYFNHLEQFPNTDPEAMRLHYMYQENVYHAYYDLDHNGTEELLIGFGQNDHIRLADVFAYDGTSAVRVLDEHVFGERARLTLRQDGTIYLQASGSAATGNVTLWQLDDSGCKAEEIFEYFYDYQMVEQEQYRLIGGTIDDMISEAEFNEIMEEHKEKQDIPWRYLDTDEMIPVQKMDAMSAYEAILADYRNACAVESSTWMSNSESYNMTYGHLGTETLFYHHMGGGSSKLFYAYHDVDGNGTDELFIGSGQNAEDAYVSTMFAFDGQQAVMLADMLFEVLNDGTVLRSGNGGGIEQILQLDENGAAFVEKEGTGIERNSMIFGQKFAEQGGIVSYNWQSLN